MMPLASCRRARWLSSFLDQRIRIARLRLSHEWHASTTHRRARHCGLCCLRSISSPRARMCGVYSRASRSSLTTGKSYALSRQRPWGSALVGFGRSIGIESSLSFSSLWSLGSRRRERARSGPHVPRREASASPPLGPVSGIGASLRPPQRCFGHRAVGRQPGPVDTDLLVVVEQPLAPDLVKDTGLLPLLKTPVRSGGVSHPVKLSAFHCIPVRGPSKIASITWRLGRPRR